MSDNGVLLAIEFTAKKGGDLAEKIFTTRP